MGPESVHNCRCLPGERSLRKGVIPIASIVSTASVADREGHITDLRELLEVLGQNLFTSLVRWVGCAAHLGCSIGWSCWIHSKACVHLGALRGSNLMFNGVEGQMRPLQEVFINLIFHKSIKCVSNALSVRVLHFLSAMNLEALLFISFLVSLAFINQIFWASSFRCVRLVHW